MVSNNKEIPPPQFQTLLKAIGAGGISGAIEVVATYPIEYVKTQLQLDTGRHVKYGNSFNCLRYTIKQKGFFGLYSGLPVLLYGSIPEVSLRFGTYEAVKAYSSQGALEVTVLQQLFFGLCAGIIEAVIVQTPMETIKVRYIKDQRFRKPRFKNFFHAVSTLFKEEGFSGLYLGMTPTIAKQGTNQMIRFFCVEQLKVAYENFYLDQSIPVYVIGIFGSIGGAFSVLCNMPIDAVKTRMQGVTQFRNQNTWMCAKTIWYKEGPRAFYKGLMPRMYKSSFDVAITFMAYDIVLGLFDIAWP